MTTEVAVSGAAGVIGGAAGGGVFGRLSPNFAPTFKSLVVSGFAGGATSGFVSGGYHGAMQAAQTSGNVLDIIRGGLAEAGKGALLGGVQGAALATALYGGVRAAPHIKAYGKALAAEIRGATAFSGMGPAEFLFSGNSKVSGPLNKGS